MATIIDNTYFTNELKLPIDNINTQSYINKHEPDVLDKTLGVELADEFTAALDGGSPAQKWVDLRDGKVYTDFSDDKQRYKGIKVIIADYVFNKIVADRQNWTTDSGVKIAMADNAENYNPREKQRFAQNDMVDRIAVMDDFINVTNSDTPDTYDNYLPETIEKGNIFNI